MSLDVAPYLATTGDGPSWLQARRQAAKEALLAKGLPTTKTEDWQYTSLKGLGGSTFDQGPATEVAASRFELTGAGIDVLPGVALPQGVEVQPLSDRWEQDAALADGLAATLVDAPFAMLNTALFADGLLIRVGKDVAVDAPLVVTWYGARAGEATYPRLRIELATGARLQVVEHFVGGGDALSSAVTEVDVSAQAHLTHLKLQDTAPTAHHFGHLHATVQRDATFRSHVISAGGSVSRTELVVRLAEAGARAELLGAYLGHDRQVHDHVLTLDHAAPHCESQQLYRGVLGERSRGVFNGKVIVREGAQKTAAEQSNKNLLLSDLAHADTKPTLEIYADDVKCSHGATVGQLDPQAVFYLRSRGIDEAAARRMLVQAFVQEVVDGIDIESVRAEVTRWLAEDLGVAR